MASIYPRGGVFWIKYRNRKGEIRRESTGLRVGVTANKRQAEVQKAERTLAEKQSRGTVVRERWDKWVKAFIDDRYRQSPKSKLRFETAWRTLRIFMEERAIGIPRQLTRDHCLEYPAWRSVPDRLTGKYRAGHNTALTELKFLGLLMKEAVIRGYASSNPCRELGLKRTKAREKSEFTAEQIGLVRSKIAELPAGAIKEFFSRSFEIARYQGCRFSETHLDPMRAVDLRAGTITFNAKGGKEHTAPLHPALRSMMEELIKVRQHETYAMPKSPAKMWWKFLTKIGLKQLDPNLCFHSTRVTVVTELARAEVHRAKAMRYVGHASTTVHQIYQKLNVEDVRSVTEKIS